MSKTLAMLVIDDSEDDRLFYQRDLAKALRDRLSFIDAANGERGLEAVAARDPDCVLLDYALPGDDGIEVLKRIRARRNVCVIVFGTVDKKQSFFSKKDCFADAIPGRRYSVCDEAAGAAAGSVKIL